MEIELKKDKSIFGQTVDSALIGTFVKTSPEIECDIQRVFGDGLFERSLIGDHVAQFFL